MQESFQLVECPRDAMQGWAEWIPTDKKIKYLNTLLTAGFHTLDFGSFVSPRAIPQMADTKEVLAELNWQESSTRLLAITANTRGAEEAVLYEGIRYLGYPFSISPTFQYKNANSSLQESFERVKEIQQICKQTGKELVIYLSMAFGNPYQDPYTKEEVLLWAQKCHDLGIRIISLADTVGLATPVQVRTLTELLIQALPAANIGVHLHSSPAHWREKTEAAFLAGCRRFDGAIHGIGGCPMAGDALVGNLNTEWLINFLMEHNIKTGINKEIFSHCLTMANEIFQV